MREDAIDVSVGWRRMEETCGFVEGSGEEWAVKDYRDNAYIRMLKYIEALAEIL